MLKINESQIPREWLPHQHVTKQPQQPFQPTSTITTTPGGGGCNKRGNPPQRVKWVNYGFCNPIIGKMWDQFVARHKEHRSLQRVSAALRAACLPNDTFIQDGLQPKECLSCQMRDMHPADCNNHHSHKEGKMPDETARKVAAKLQKGINAINANPEQFIDQRDSNKRSRN